ncbi:uncharacterized protein LOC131298522 [Rhododendron vialii]|uniref:uncharacterized protein LOC131298522 n=1 Tax=Rhododendron vialii TaxID=182163 RepID=UPI00265F14C5|nr:uncharacterized protein LOC131298522 [Rhododendron vialii]
MHNLCLPICGQSHYQLVGVVGSLEEISSSKNLVFLFFWCFLFLDWFLQETFWMTFFAILTRTSIVEKSLVRMSKQRGMDCLNNKEKVLILGLPLDSDVKDIIWSTCHVLLTWGGLHLFTNLDDFHGGHSSSVSHIEFSELLSCNGEKRNPNNSIILEENWTEGAYPRDIGQLILNLDHLNAETVSCLCRYCGDSCFSAYSNLAGTTDCHYADRFCCAIWRTRLPNTLLAGSLRLTARTTIKPTLWQSGHCSALRTPQLQEINSFCIEPLLFHFNCSSIFGLYSPVICFTFFGLY